ncbi:hypothetical protein L9F63_009215, partial [Diploptera punctata]
QGVNNRHGKMQAFLLCTCRLSFVLRVLTEQLDHGLILPEGRSENVLPIWIFSGKDRFMYHAEYQIMATSTLTSTISLLAVQGDLLTDIHYVFAEFILCGKN